MGTFLACMIVLAFVVLPIVGLIAAVWILVLWIWAKIADWRSLKAAGVKKQRLRWRDMFREY